MGGIAPFWGIANLPEKVSRDMGYRNSGIVMSREMGPLSTAQQCHLRDWDDQRRNAAGHQLSTVQKIGVQYDDC